MIRGLGHFKEYFKEYNESYILVGGVASYLFLEEAGATKLRPTKDLDIVLVMEPTEKFLYKLKKYIKDGG